MKSFHIELMKAGQPIITRRGSEPRSVVTTLLGFYGHLTGFIDAQSCLWDMTGVCLYPPGSRDLDLFMKSSPRTMYIIVWKIHDMFSTATYHADVLFLKPEVYVVGFKASTHSGHTKEIVSILETTVDE